MSLDSKFNAKEAEKRIFSLWQESGVFRSGQGKNTKAPPYSIMIPPPNVTGSLHIGHAFNNTLQDILARLHRMKGYDVLWQPGQDHAGIATQMVVERELEKEGKKRESLGREKFLEKVWEWKEKSGDTIINQLKRLGASCDWDRNRFTMDPDFQKSVIKVFVDFYHKGLIYKGTKLVKWDPKFQTAISDLEVEQIEVNGYLWELKYFLEEGSFKFGLEFDEDGKVTKYEDRNYCIIATTRPETLLGDTAVIVNSKDQRYKDLVGRKLVLPIVGRIIPVIQDDYADPNKGTGAVKITPAHDFNDWEVGKRNNLREINIFDEKAHIKIEENEEFLRDINPVEELWGLHGLERFEAREKILEVLKKYDWFEQESSDTHYVPHGDRSKVVVEPFLTSQWFVDTEKLVDRAMQVVKSNEIEIIPERDKKVYFNWLENIEPWCISRQLWWGHQIPVWYDENGTEYCAETEEEAKTLAGEKVLFRDPDVLDTWFSSGIWPIGTLGWPEKTKELEKYYPTSVLVTGFDIIFFWVARMIMMQLATVGKVPFKKVYVHALVRDEKGKKMSKSLGNVLDPLILIDKYGADALRFTLAAMAVTGRDLKLSESRIEGYRNFVTKIWNAARFIELNNCTLNEDFDPMLTKQPANIWIISETKRTLELVEENFEKFRFNDIANTLYNHTWKVFCDWYVEFSKALLNSSDSKIVKETKDTVAWAFDQCLIMLHPIMPFVTEELWNGHGQSRELLTQAQWPELQDIILSSEKVKEINWVIAFIERIRSTKSDFNLLGGERTELLVLDKNHKLFDRLTEHSELVCKLARLKEIKIIDDRPANAIIVSGGDLDCFIPILRDFDVELEKERINKSLNKLEVENEKLSMKLKNKEFMKRAPEEVIKNFLQSQKELAIQLDKQNRILESLKKLK